MTRLRIITAATLGVMMALAPASGFADPGNGKGNGRHHVRVETRDIVIERDRDRHRDYDHDRHGDRDRERRHDRGIVYANCPPGLAKKNPPCIPPGQVRRDHDDRDHDDWGRDRDHRHIRVGDVLDWDDVHIIRDPGLYGLGNPPYGNRYAIVDGQLVRVESDTGRLLSIIRLVNAILD